MKSLPTAPAPGTPVSSSLIRELIDAIRARTILRGPGYRTRETPNGTALEIEGTAGGRTAYKKIPGRFEISLKAEDPQESDEEEEQEQTYSATFANPYYDIGGKTYEMPADEEADPPAVGLGGIKDGDIIVLKIAAGQSRGEELVTVGSLAELQTLQEDVAYYSIPLYKVQGGSVVCDFRTGPISGMGEFAS